MSLEVALLASIGAAVLAGIGYNTLGIWKAYRKGGDASVDWSKVKKNVIIGGILGLIGFGLTLTKALPIPEIVDVNTFIGAIIAYFPLVVVAEGIFVKESDEADED